MKTRKPPVKRRRNRPKPETEPHISHGNPAEGGKVSPEEAARIESYDLPTGEGGLHGPEMSWEGIPHEEMGEPEKK